MARANKPYSRPPGGSDGAWTHDAYQASNPSSLSSRLSSSTPSSSSARPGRGSSKGTDLLSRISGGQGKELISAPRSKGMLGFQTSAPANINNVNSGLELLPVGGSNGEGRLNGASASGGTGVGPVRRGGQRVQLNQGLIGSAMASVLNPQSSQSTMRDRKDKPKELFPNRAGAKQRGNRDTGMESDRYGRYDQPVRAESHVQAQSISVMGRSVPKTIWVTVDNLAQGTTPDDVVAAFAPAPISSARSSTPFNPSLVCVEVELASQTAADEIISTYNGVVADGNTLKVEMVRPSLSNRLAGGAGTSAGGRTRDGTVERREEVRRGYEDDGMEVDGGNDGRELVGGSSSKMYSDSILASNPTSHITTLASDDTAQKQRASAWSQATPHVQGRGLASRVGGGARW